MVSENEGNKRLLENVEESLRYYNFKIMLTDYDKEILKAISEVDRKYFVHGYEESQAYIDAALSIGQNQTISQPSTVARMLQLVELKKGNKVLEIGTGSGWNAALIAFLIGERGKLLTLEVYEDLIEKAKLSLNHYNFKNIKISNEDFRKIPEEQKFDRIIFTAGVGKSQEYIVHDYAKVHLNEGGILLCPYRNGPLIIIKKYNNKMIISYTRYPEEYLFVPLILD